MQAVFPESDFQSKEDMEEDLAEAEASAEEEDSEEADSVRLPTEAVVSFFRFFGGADVSEPC